MSRFPSWFRKHVIEYAGRNPFPASVSLAVALGTTYAAEQQFERTNFCKRLWVAAHLTKRTYFQTDSMHLHNPSLHYAMTFSLSRDMSQQHEQIDSHSSNTKDEHSGLRSLCFDFHTAGRNTYIRSWSPCRGADHQESGVEIRTLTFNFDYSSDSFPPFHGGEISSICSAGKKYLMM